MAAKKYEDIKLDIVEDGKIGIIKFNRPKTLNAFGGKMISEFKDALRFLDKHPTTVFTVLTGEGRFFSSGADVKAQANTPALTADTEAELKDLYSMRMGPSVDLIRDMIDHSKVFVVAQNGGGVGGGAVWFQGAADILLASDTAFLQVPFGALGLVPEAGSGVLFPENMGLRRATEFLMFGTKLEAQDMLKFGMANRIFPTATFHQDVLNYLKQQLANNDHSSLLLTKKLMTKPLRDKRVHAVAEAHDLLAVMFSKGLPQKRFAEKAKEMEAKSKAKI